MAVKLAAAFLVIVLGTVAAQTQDPCADVLTSLTPCIDFVTGTSSTPSPSCCSNLSSVISNQATCLCTLLNSGGASGDQTKALSLPTACNIQTPPVSLCKDVSPPTAPSANSTPPPPGTPHTGSGGRATGGAFATAGGILVIAALMGSRWMGF